MMVSSPRRGDRASNRPTCESCRQRKVRCNRQIPCSQCSRLRLACIYEKRKRRRPISASFGQSIPSKPLTRLSSQSSINSETGSPHHCDDQPTNRDIVDRLSRIEGSISGLIQGLNCGQLNNCGIEATSVASDKKPPAAVLVPPAQSTGELPVDDRARGSYVDDPMFMRLYLESENMVSPTIPESQTLKTDDLPVQLGFAVTDALGCRVNGLTIPPEFYRKLWGFYLQNFDPLVKLLHVPTIQPVVLGTVSNIETADDSILALVYAIAFAATVTLSNSETLRHFHLEKTTLLRHLMQEMDNAFMKGQFMIRPNTTSLTALVIYLTALRNYDTSRPVWILIGVAIRVAESLGVHRDGSELGLGLFESEKRRRLWWHLTALDATAPENHGFNSTSVDRECTSSLPHNIDDRDIFPGVEETPIEKAHWTEMSFFIMNLDICRLLRRTVISAAKDCNDLKSEIINQTQHQICQKWLQLTDLTKPICQAADALVKISVLKAKFILDLQSWLLSTPNCEPKYCELPQPIFVTAIKLLEEGYLLQSGKLFPNYAWFFGQHPQFYALFLVLRLLQTMPNWTETERAWVVVDDYFTCLTDFEEASARRGRTSCVWSALGALREHARASWHQDPKQFPSPQDQNSTSLQVDVVGSAGRHINDDVLSPSAEIDNFSVWQDFSDWLNPGAGFCDFFN